MPGPLLAGKVAALLGGAGDIGSEVGRAFAAEGASVAVLDLDEQRAVARAAGLQGSGATAIGMAADALDFDSAGAVLGGVRHELGRLDVFMYMVGWAALRPALEVPSAEFVRTLDVNLSGQFAWACAAAELMAAQGGGAIVLMGSILGFGGTPRRVAYNSSRGGCIQLTRALAVEWAPRGIRVNAVAPGWVETQALVAAGIPLEPLARRSPSGRLGTPADIAGPALFLASDLSRWVAGVTLPVDGGTTAYVGPGDPPDA
jgi:NAD(P)-dependent dehydrogenase (short-subunit alcohol dehydrogenase family)